MAKAYEYEWSPNARRLGFHRYDVEASRELLKKLSDEGELDAEHVVKEAAKPDCIWHDASCWSWNDPIHAAKRWDLSCATVLINGPREVTVTSDGGRVIRDAVPAFVQTGKRTLRGHGDTYASIERTMADPVLRLEYLARIRGEMDRLDRQYALLLSRYPEIRRKLAEVRAAIDLELAAPSE